MAAAALDPEETRVDARPPADGVVVDTTRRTDDGSMVEDGRTRLSAGC